MVRMQAAAFPRSHVLNKIAGERLNISWLISNFGDQPGIAWMILEVETNGIWFDMGGISRTIPAGAIDFEFRRDQISLDPSDFRNGPDTYNMRLLVEEDIGGGPFEPRPVFATHNFTIIWEGGGGPGGPEFVPSTDPQHPQIF